VLLALLAADDAGDVHLEPVEPQAVAAVGELGDDRRAEVVDVEAHGLLGIAGLHVQVMDADGHGRAPQMIPRCARSPI
jgi:hypothetical protein